MTKVTEITGIDWYMFGARWVFRCQPEPCDFRTTFGETLKRKSCAIRRSKMRMLQFVLFFFVPYSLCFVDKTEATRMSNGDGDRKYWLNGLKVNAAIVTKWSLTDGRLECLKIASSKSKTKAIMGNYLDKRQTTTKYSSRSKFTFLI